jgi:hypothetical protein
MNINLARRTLERLRVMALNNELSGEPLYRSGSNPSNYCYCAVGALLPDDILTTIDYDGHNSEDVPTALDEYMEEVGMLTGLSSRMLEDLQQAHDDRYPKTQGWVTLRDRANLSVLEFTTHALATMF